MLLISGEHLLHPNPRQFTKLRLNIDLHLDSRWSNHISRADSSLGYRVTREEKTHIGHHLSLHRNVQWGLSSPQSVTSKLVNSNVGWETSFPVSVEFTPASLPSKQTAQANQEVKSLNLNFSYHAWSQGTSKGISYKTLRTARHKIWQTPNLSYPSNPRTPRNDNFSCASLTHLPMCMQPKTMGRKGEVKYTSSRNQCHSIWGRKYFIELN